MEDQGPRYDVDGVRLRPDDPAWQHALERAYATSAQPLCLCRPSGIPMYIARYQQFVVKRLPDTGHQHHPTCPSYEPPPGQSGLGEVLGEAVIERAPDRHGSTWASRAWREHAGRPRRREPAKDLRLGLIGTAPGHWR